MQRTFCVEPMQDGAQGTRASGGMGATTFSYGEVFASRCVR
ncbi:hypothetical protein HMPREF1316_0449 [Olsenella profusa F0195]|uniref:Uncharacterized protein n=1 Tax=Olsenella profusa F0195 TaxID=1125712 RepID=U2V7U7_9ACTN|nr:hypothetical protein HMPREF1316_0449 [Olsenella profusa F0195]